MSTTTAPVSANPSGNNASASSASSSSSANPNQAVAPAPAPNSANPYASASLYVGDLAPDVNESILFDIFNVVGPVASVRVCRDALTRRSLGYAYVNFHDVHDAERALDTLNFSMIRDRQCRIMWSHRDPTIRKSGAGNIYVKNLDLSIDSKTLYDTFSVFGDILSCKVVTDENDKSLGYGFVHFENDDAAKTAISTVNGKMIANQVVSVQPFKSRKEREGVDQKFTNIYVKNLPADCTLDKLKAYFGKHGKVTSAFMPMDEKNNRPRGFGFINFESHEQASSAINALNDVAWGENKLVVTKAQKKSERERELRSRFEQARIERQNKFRGTNLYIKNLADDVNTDKLIEEFKKFGDISSARVMMDQANNKSRGFGFVCFSNSEEATKAVTEMNGKMVSGKPLYVALAQPRDVRRAQLESQFSTRKIPFIQPGLYPPQGPPFFFAPQRIPQGMMFPAPMPQQRMRPAWNGAPQGGPQGRGAPVMPFAQYGMHVPPLNQRGHPQRGGRGGQRGGPQHKGFRGGMSGVPNAQGGVRRGNPNAPNFNYTNQARNKPAPSNMAPQGQLPMVIGQGHGNMPQGQLTIQELAAAPQEQQKKMIGDRLFALIQEQEPNLAAKITGMLLDMEIGELLHLLESQAALNEKIQEALEVLKSAGSGNADGEDDQ